MRHSKHLVLLTVFVASCGGRTFLEETVGPAVEPGPDGGAAPEAAAGSDSSSGDDASAGSDSARGSDSPSAPDSEPASDSGVTLDGGTRCTVNSSSESGGAGGACKVDFNGTCSGGLTFQIQCDCPSAQCSCSTEFSSGGGGGAYVPYAGCPTCSMEEAWKACALSLSAH